jgi:N-carbamoylputrescine amidase
MEKKHLLLGVVQIDSCVGDVSGNLKHAGDLVEEAANQGAQLVLLPELMPSGYTLTEEIWDYAEPFYGQTVGWLTQAARQLHIYLGTSFLEVEGEDFYNTFALASPQGDVAGKVRKSPPASLEAYFYTSGSGSHVIETELGRIGVGICFENLIYEGIEGLFQASVDLVLQPTAAGRPKPMRPGDIELFDSMIKRCAPYYARTLGVPVALANRTGIIHTELPGGYGDFNSSFPGLSQIVDSDGRIKAKIGDGEGVLVAEVELNPGLKSSRKPRCYGKMWAFPMPWYAFIWPETQHEGEKDYQSNPRRKEKALKKGINK